MQIHSGGETMMRKVYGYVVVVLLAVFLSGCGASFQGSSDIARGRQSLFSGDNQGALGYFQSAAQANPNYIYGTELREGVASYLGRAQYLSGQLPAAQATLQQAVAQHKSDNLARLYLGLTQARQGDRKAALVNIESGLKGMQQFVNYIVNTFANSFGSFWDQDGSVRKALATNLSTVASGNFDWPTLISNCETVALNYEQLEDIATQNQRQFQEMNRP
jgi:tetratricopeptide (TPR) repeat protein